MKKTEMYIELTMSGFSEKIEDVVLRVPKGYTEVLKKGSAIVSDNNAFGESTALRDSLGKPRRWKENAISYKKNSKSFSLGKDILAVIPTLKKLKKMSLKNASIGIKCVVYYGDDRVDLFLPEEIIASLSENNSYLDIVVY